MCACIQHKGAMWHKSQARRSANCRLWSHNSQAYGAVEAFFSSHHHHFTEAMLCQLQAA